MGIGNNEIHSLVIPTYNRDFYSEFIDGSHSSYSCITSESISQIMRYCQTSPWRPWMYVSYEFRDFLKNTIPEVTKKFGMPSGYTLEQRCTILQCAGDYDRAGEMLRRLNVPNISIEQAYLLCVQRLITEGTRFTDQKFFNFIVSQKPETLTRNERVLLLQSLHKLLTLFAHYRKDDAWFTVVYQLSERLLQYLDGFDRAIAEVRVFGYLAAVDFNRKKIARAIMTLKNALKLIDQIGKTRLQNSYELFLLKETKRRLLRDLDFYFSQQRNTSARESAIRQLQQIDPYCSEVRLLQLEHEHRQSVRKTVAHYHFNNIETGVYDIKFAINLEDAPNGDPLLSEVFVIRSLDDVSTASPDSLKWFKGYFRSAKLQGSKRIHFALRNSDTHIPIKERLFYPFIDLKQFPEVPLDSFQESVLLAKEAFDNNVSPLYETHYALPNASHDFRRELGLFLTNNTYNSERVKRIQDIPEFLRQTNINKKNHANYLRLLTTLGFQIETYNLLPIRKLKKEYPNLDNPSHLVMWSTMGHLFARLRPRKEREIGWKYPSVIDREIAGLATNNTNARLKFVSLLRLIVFYGKDERILSNVEQFVKQAKKMIPFIERHQRLSEFEKHLLFSNYHRTVAFLHQLRGEFDTLIETMKQCEYHGKQALNIAKRTGQKKWLILAKDALLAYYETMSRVCELTGDKEGAMRNMQKAVRLDPFCSKSWTQLGEVQFKQNNFIDARMSFLQAVSLGPPLHPQSWFLLAHTYRKLKEHNLAYVAFCESLRSLPYSRELARTVLSMTGKFHDVAMELWTKKLLRALTH